MWHFASRVSYRSWRQKERDESGTWSRGVHVGTHTRTISKSTSSSTVVFTIGPPRAAREMAVTSGCCIYPWWGSHISLGFLTLNFWISLLWKHGKYYDLSVVLALKIVSLYCLSHRHLTGTWSRQGCGHCIQVRGSVNPAARERLISQGKCKHIWGNVVLRLSFGFSCLWQTSTPWQG